ncbi:putative Ig domain-containing protein [Cnuibacter sp. UC19_7]|uniref:putative Ig domain-containing protein n=1 Tax=Cnuibacter sp. UC19_7 TaxID=3350166 RepID=UPI003670849A
MFRSRALLVAAAAGVIAAVAGLPTVAQAAPAPIDPWVQSTGTAGVMTVDSGGNVYIVNLGDMKIDKYGPDGDRLARYDLDPASLPRDIGADGLGNVYVADDGLGTIARISPTAGLEKKWLPVPTGSPSAIDVRADGTIYIASFGSKNVYRLNPAGALDLFMVAHAPVGDVGSSPSGDVLTANDDGTISKIAADGTFTDVLVTLTRGADLTDIEVRKDGSFVVYNDTYTTISESSPSGSTIRSTVWPKKIFDITLDSAGDIYFVDTDSRVLRTMPHAGGDSPLPVVKFASKGTAQSLVMSDRQILYTSWGSDPTISAVPLLPEMSSPAISASIPEGGTFTSSVTSSGGLDPTSFAAVDLPSWLTLDPIRGTLSGTATVAGTYRFQLVAMNKVGESDPQPAEIIVTPAVVPTPSPNPTSGGTTGAGGSGSGSAGNPAAGGGSGSAATGRGALASTGHDGAVALAGALTAGGIALAGVAGMVLTWRRREVRAND